MLAESIPLRFAGTRRIARLRELTGRDEYAVMGTNTANAIALLASLLESDPATGTDKLCAEDLVAADRDRLLAAVYRAAFGDRIESTLPCEKCKQPFDLDFSLQSVIALINKTDETVEYMPLDGGSFRASNGLSFRLPTGRDELVAAGATTDEIKSLLLNRCTEDREWPEGAIAFEELIERVAPLIDLELLASCPECSHVHKVEFDIQTYLLGALVAERRRLLADINRIAATYSWSLEEILSLTRNDRRHLVELIENGYAA